MSATHQPPKVLDNHQWMPRPSFTDLPRPFTFLKGPSFRPFKLDIARSIWASLFNLSQEPIADHA